MRFVDPVPVLVVKIPFFPTFLPSSQTNPPLLRYLHPSRCLPSGLLSRLSKDTSKIWEIPKSSFLTHEDFIRAVFNWRPLKPATGRLAVSNFLYFILWFLSVHGNHSQYREPLQCSLPLCPLGGRSFISKPNKELQMMVKPGKF